MSGNDPEAQLREVLGALAERVEPASDAYHRAGAQWQRHGRRKRLLVVTPRRGVVPP